MNTSSCVVFVVLFVLKTTDCASPRSTSSSQDESGLSHEAGQVHSTTGGSNLLNQTEPSLTGPSLTEPSLTEPSLTEPSLTEPSLSGPAGFAPESNKVCGVTEHNSRFGFITSPNYPRSYDNNQTCLWSIQAPAGHVCYVIFNAFDLEPGPDHSRLSCPFDFLHIFEEFQIEPDNPELVYRHSWGTYCGRNRPPRRSSARPGSTLYFYFRSDVSRRGKGFVLNYQMMNASSRRADEEIPVDSGAEEPKDYQWEYLKLFSAVLFLFILCTTLVGAIYRCWLSSNDPLEAGNCCGTMDLDVINDHPGRGFSTRRTSPSPTLPTPPPTYEDVVKTEEDWNRVITQLGEASAAALRERRAAEELQVTYDLDVSDDESKAPSSQSSYTSESEMTSRSSFTLSSGSTVELESVRTEVASQGSIGQ